MVGLLFPGQGAQFVGMGRDLASRFPLAKQAFEEADESLGFALSRTAWDGSETELTATSNAQPAILVHSIAVWRILRERLGDVVLAAGHSLGEFSAYVAADALSFADAVRTVRRRGELMLEAGNARPGAMAAVIGLEDAAVERLCADASGSTDGVCVAANFNSPAQVVISGDHAAVGRAMALARAAGAKRVLPLNVSGAFHSPLMEPAQAGLGAALGTVALADPTFPVVSNVTAEPVADATRARALLLEQLTSPVRWTASMRTMLGAGITQFVEIGPGAVLCGLLKRTERGRTCTSVGTAAQLAGFAGVGTV
ncbi:MAG: ACP S-malonyltransferase [Longimicrobiales bacterium]